MKTIGTVRDNLVHLDWMMKEPVPVHSEHAGVSLLTAIACSMVGLPDRSHQLPDELSDIMVCKLSDEWLMAVAVDPENGGRKVGVGTWEAFRKTHPDVVEKLEQLLDLATAPEHDKH